MPTSLQDPQRAKRQREETLREDPFLSEKEWVPLWLAGPLLGLLFIFGAIGLLHMVLRIGELLGK